MTSNLVPGCSRHCVTLAKSSAAPRPDRRGPPSYLPHQVFALESPGQRTFLPKSRTIGDCLPGGLSVLSRTCARKANTNTDVVLQSLSWSQRGHGAKMSQLQIEDWGRSSCLCSNGMLPETPGDRPGRPRPLPSPQDLCGLKVKC